MCLYIDCCVVINIPTLAGTYHPCLFFCLNFSPPYVCVASIYDRTLYISKQDEARRDSAHTPLTATSLTHAFLCVFYITYIIYDIILHFSHFTHYTYALFYAIPIHPCIVSTRSEACPDSFWSQLLRVPIVFHIIRGAPR